MNKQISCKDTTGVPKIYKGGLARQMGLTKLQYFLKFAITTLIGTAIGSWLVFSFDNDQGLSYSYYFIFYLPCTALGVLTVDIIWIINKRKRNSKWIN
jgi:uncharacterized membrane protein YfcA